jgi:putative ABC transport system permease protein
MEQTVDIKYLDLFLGYLLMLVPILILGYYRTGLIKDTVIAIVRMTIQLLLVGIYLEYLFDLNHIGINLAWVVLMTIIASFTIIRRSGLNLKVFFTPVLISGIISISLTVFIFLGIVVKSETLYEARYFIPVTGMLLGNTIKTVIIAADEFYLKIKEEGNQYRWYLANGATRKEALEPYMRSAIRKSINPLIATTAIMGLISLPGMMTGQILGGSSPNVAVKYQIMILIVIFAASVLNVLLTILISNRYAFDGFYNLKKDVFRREKSK